VPASTPGPATGITLAVKPYAQNLHKGQYVQYGGGGEAWCSPTSTEMVVEFWGRGPTAEQLAWIDKSYVDPSVDQAARYSYDYGYQGTGNWPFTCAYAASYGLDAMVVRLNSLTELEVLVAAGFPVVTSQSFTLAENGYYASDGHLWCVIGFTDTGQQQRLRRVHGVSAADVRDRLAAHQLHEGRRHPGVRLGRCRVPDQAARQGVAGGRGPAEPELAFRTLGMTD
jgi:hypothetical protein